MGCGGCKYDSFQDTFALDRNTFISLQDSTVHFSSDDMLRVHEENTQEVFILIEGAEYLFYGQKIKNGSCKPLIVDSVRLLEYSE